jgi:hypothetical protein
MLRPLFSAVVAGCFALSAITWGTMPGCVVPTDPAAAQAAPGHEKSHQHPAQPGKLPGSVHCIVHLCCVQVTTPPATAVATARLTAPDRSVGLVPAIVFVLVRPSHTLPFAHAPPHLSA